MATTRKVNPQRPHPKDVTWSLARSSVFAHGVHPETAFSKFAPSAALLSEAEDELTIDTSVLYELKEEMCAEFVGTFFLVLTVGVAVASGGSLAAVAIGGILAVQIYTFGSVSGALFNPAVTLALFLTGRGKIGKTKAVLYVVVQLLGGLAAGFVSLGVTSTTFCFDYAATPKGGSGTSLVLELIWTMALCNSVLATAASFSAPNQYFGAVIGGTVTAGAIACGGWDQGSFNPAVTLGMNIANYGNSNSTMHPSVGAWLLFMLAPFVGAILAAAIFRGTRHMEFLGRHVHIKAASVEAFYMYEKLVAEFVGTFMLVMTIGISVPGGGLLAPIAIGSILGIQVYTFGSVSGGLFNPAVTLALWMSRRNKITHVQAAMYCVVQMIGGLVGGLVAFAVTRSSFCFDNSFYGSATLGAPVILEFLYTAVLCSVVLAAGTSFDAPNQYFGLAIGGAVMFAAAACGKFDQGSFNPAVTFGINIANFANPNRAWVPSSGAWATFFLCPMLGAILAAAIFRTARDDTEYARRVVAATAPAAAKPAVAEEDEYKYKAQDTMMVV